MVTVMMMLMMMMMMMTTKTDDDDDDEEEDDDDDEDDDDGGDVDDDDCDGDDDDCDANHHDESWCSWLILMMLTTALFVKLLNLTFLCSDHHGEKRNMKRCKHNPNSKDWRMIENAQHTLVSILYHPVLNPEQGTSLRSRE